MELDNPSKRDRGHNILFVGKVPKMILPASLGMSNEAKTVSVTYYVH